MKCNRASAGMTPRCWMPCVNITAWRSRRRDVARQSISIMIGDLSPGMVLHSNIETKDGTLILRAGTTSPR